MNTKKFPSLLFHCFKCLIFVSCLSFEIVFAVPANQIGSELKSQCNKEYSKIQMQLKDAKKVSECDAAFDIYKDNLVKCHREVIEDEMNFPEVSFDIADCYYDKKFANKAKEVFEFSLKTAPDWTYTGPVGCSGHDVLAEALESLNMFENEGPQCVSKPELKDILNKFKSTHDLSLLKKIRGGTFGVASNTEFCPYPFAKFDREIAQNLNGSNLVITPMNEQQGDDNLYQVVITGFKDNPNKALVLFFANLNYVGRDEGKQPEQMDMDDENDPNDESDQGPHINQGPQNNLISEKTQNDQNDQNGKNSKIAQNTKNEPCYSLALFRIYENKQDMVDEDQEPQN